MIRVLKEAFDRAIREEALNLCARDGKGLLDLLSADEQEVYIARAKQKLKDYLAVYIKRL